MRPVVFPVRPATKNARRSLATVPFAALFSVTVVGCSSEDPAASSPEPGAVELRDEHSFESHSELFIDTVTTAAGGEVEACWSGVEEDLLCHPAAPVQSLFLLRISEADPQAVVARILANELSDYVDATLRHSVADGETCANLGDFLAGEEAIDIDTEYYESDQHSYLMLFSNGTSLGQGTLSMTLLKPGGSTTELAGPSGCGELQYEADLSHLTPLELPSSGPWVVDWRGLTRAGDGGEVPFSSIDRLLIGFYEGRDVAYLEENIFDIEEDPQATFWELELDGQRSADLALAEDADGERFAGFARETEGVWLLGLLCKSCQNPAPVLLTIIEPVP